MIKMAIAGAAAKDTNYYILYCCRHCDKKFECQKTLEEHINHCVKAAVSTLNIKKEPTEASSHSQSNVKISSCDQKSSSAINIKQEPVEYDYGSSLLPHRPLECPARSEPSSMFGVDTNVRFHAPSQDCFRQTQQQQQMMKVKPVMSKQSNQTLGYLSQQHLSALVPNSYAARSITIGQRPWHLPAHATNAAQDYTKTTTTSPMSMVQQPSMAVSCGPCSSSQSSHIQSSGKTAGKMDGSSGRRKISPKRKASPSPTGSRQENVCLKTSVANSNFLGTDLCATSPSSAGFKGTVAEKKPEAKVTRRVANSFSQAQGAQTNSVRASLKTSSACTKAVTSQGLQQASKGIGAGVVRPSHVPHLLLSSSLQPPNFLQAAPRFFPQQANVIVSPVESVKKPEATTFLTSPYNSVQNSPALQNFFSQGLLKVSVASNINIPVFLAGSQPSTGNAYAGLNSPTSGAVQNVPCASVSSACHITSVSSANSREVNPRICPQRIASKSQLEFPVASTVLKAGQPRQSLLGHNQTSQMPTLQGPNLPEKANLSRSTATTNDVLSGQSTLSALPHAASISSASSVFSIQPGGSQGSSAQSLASSQQQALRLTQPSLSTSASNIVLLPPMLSGGYVLGGISLQPTSLIKPSSTAQQASPPGALAQHLVDQPIMSPLHQMVPSVQLGQPVLSSVPVAQLGQPVFSSVPVGQSALHSVPVAQSALPSLSVAQSALPSAAFGQSLLSSVPLVKTPVSSLSFLSSGMTLMPQGQPPLSLPQSNDKVGSSIALGHLEPPTSVSATFSKKTSEKTLCTVPLKPKTLADTDTKHTASTNQLFERPKSYNARRQCSNSKTLSAEKMSEKPPYTESKVNKQRAFIDQPSEKSKIGLKFHNSGTLSVPPQTKNNSMPLVLHHPMEIGVLSIAENLLFGDDTTHGRRVVALPDGRLFVPVAYNGPYFLQPHESAKECRDSFGSSEDDRELSITIAGDVVWLFLDKDGPKILRKLDDGNIFRPEKAKPTILQKPKSTILQKPDHPRAAIIPIGHDLPKKAMEQVCDMLRLSGIQFVNTATSPVDLSVYNNKLGEMCARQSDETHTLLSKRFLPILPHEISPLFPINSLSAECQKTVQVKYPHSVPDITFPAVSSAATNAGVVQPVSSDFLLSKANVQDQNQPQNATEKQPPFAKRQLDGKASIAYESQPDQRPQQHNLVVAADRDIVKHALTAVVRLERLGLTESLRQQLQGRATCAQSRGQVDCPMKKGKNKFATRKRKMQDVSEPPIVEKEPCKTFRQGHGVAETTGSIITKDPLADTEVRRSVRIFHKPRPNYTMLDDELEEENDIGEIYCKPSLSCATSDDALNDDDKKEDGHSNVTTDDALNDDDKKGDEHSYATLDDDDDKKGDKQSLNSNDSENIVHFEASKAEKECIKNSTDDEGNDIVCLDDKTKSLGQHEGYDVYIDTDEFNYDYFADAAVVDLTDKDNPIKDHQSITTCKL